ncbi:MAG TPA: ABC transporter permease [Polyangiaceae bacterium]|nr:ABC transporter permease [Polyangiaceae bacterium]
MTPPGPPRRASTPPGPPRRASAPPGPLRRASTLLYRRRLFYLSLLLAPPLLWFGPVYAGSLFALLVQSFYRVDEFSGSVVEEPSLETYRALVGSAAHLDIVARTVAMAAAVTVACALVAFPVAYYAARYARGRTRAAFYLAVMTPLWASYLVKVYAWRLLLAREGIVTWLFESLGLGRALALVLDAPVVGGPSLSASHLGTFLVFTYMWLPFMILPTQAALERVPLPLLEASADLGARPLATFARVILPLAMPGVVAGSVFTFSLTLGDYIIPSLVGTPGFFIGMMVYQQQGTAGNVPLAAAFSTVPVALVAAYLALAKKAGALDAL